VFACAQKGIVNSEVLRQGGNAVNVSFATLFQLLSLIAFVPNQSLVVGMKLSAQVMWYIRAELATVMLNCTVGTGSLNTGTNCFSSTSFIVLFSLKKKKKKERKRRGP